ncbi:MAG: PPC domain-containing protein, partial [Planctomycetales bacterium]|nr:PPC domain-containing protein [Planctomycetales bacterium]
MLHLPLGSTARSMAALCGYFSGFCALSMVSAAPPVIEDITPRGIAPGATQRLEIRGSDLGEITQIWTSFPARQHVVGSDAQQGAASEEPAVDPVRHSCQLSIARDEQVGVAAIRVATEAGVSPWQLLMIDDLPSLAETNDHDQRQNAQPVDWPLAIDGTSDALKSDYYRLEIVEPTELSFEVVAQRIASPLDAVLTLYDEAGEPLTVSDDDPGTGADSRFVFRFPSAGVYYLSLRDVQYRGGAEYRYRLRVGRFPLIRCVYPLGARAKSVVDFEFLGLDGALLGRQNLLLGRLASCTAQGQLGLSLKLPGHDASGFTSIAAGGMLESVLER